jgi:hypothetical protein
MLVNSYNILFMKFTIESNLECKLKGQIQCQRLFKKIIYTKIESRNCSILSIVFLKENPFD